MRQLLSVAVAAALLAPVLNAGEIESGITEGKEIAPFYVTKCAGEKADNVPLGEELCYRCKNGSRPQVMVFTHEGDEKVAALAKKLDKAIKKYSDDELRVFVAVLGKDKEVATKQAKHLAAQAKTENIPYVVPNDVEKGPGKYTLNPKAKVTVIIANENKVVANYAVASTKELEVDAVLSSVKKMLN